MDYLVKHNEKFIKNVSDAIAHEACNQKENNKLNAIWRKAYKKQGYIFLSRENDFSLSYSVVLLNFFQLLLVHNIINFILF